MWYSSLQLLLSERESEGFCSASTFFSRRIRPLISQVGGLGWGESLPASSSPPSPYPFQLDFISIYVFPLSTFPRSCSSDSPSQRARACVFMNKTSSIIDIRKSTANVCNMDSYCQSLFRKHYCIHSCVLTCCKQRAPPFFSPTLSAATVQTVFQARVDCQTVVIQIEKRVRVSHARKSPNQCKTLVCVVIIRVQE